MGGLPFPQDECESLYPTNSSQLAGKEVQGTVERSTGHLTQAAEGRAAHDFGQGFQLLDARGGPSIGVMVVPEELMASSTEEPSGTVTGWSLMARVTGMGWASLDAASISVD